MAEGQTAPGPPGPGPRAGTQPQLAGPSPIPRVDELLGGRKPSRAEIQYAAGVAIGLGLGIFLGLRLGRHLAGAQLRSGAAVPAVENAVPAKRAPCAECDEREKRAHAQNLEVLREEARKAAEAAGIELGDNITVEDVLAVHRAIQQIPVAPPAAEPAADPEAPVSVIPGEAPPIHDLP